MTENRKQEQEFLKECIQKFLGRSDLTYLHVGNDSGEIILSRGEQSKGSDEGNSAIGFDVSDASEANELVTGKHLGKITKIY